ncbi:MAG: hypothetical protein AB4372_21620 [Xenococcus sp. (in: cyanobacteria)]
MTQKQLCHHCEGKGYINIRDCAGEIQRTETCSFCYGLGYQETELDKEIEE